MKIKAENIELVDISKIVPNPKNPNTHSKEQIKRLSKLIENTGFRNPLIVSKKSGFLVVGHGRLEAAKSLKMVTVPVIYQEFDNDAEEYAYMTADNAIGSWSELDLNQIKLEIEEFKNFDIEMLGLESLDDKSEKEDEPYVRTVEAPIYEIRGEKPSVDSVYNKDKYTSMLKKIEESNCAEEVKQFLIHAAGRHIVFNYEKIAEFYAHADESLKDLMEDSALVIIDYNKAIENGFVELTKNMAGAYAAD